MNSVEELVSYGISKENISQMIESYQKRIGTVNGDYKIIDISYNPYTKARVVKLKSPKGKVTDFDSVMCGFESH